MARVLTRCGFINFSAPTHYQSFYQEPTERKAPKDIFFSTHYLQDYSDKLNCRQDHFEFLEIEPVARHFLPFISYQSLNKLHRLRIYKWGKEVGTGII